MDAASAFRSEIARRLGVEAERIALFWKGRVALYSLLRAMGVGPGDEVIIPAYTCVVVPNAVLYCGATPVYVDIELDTFCPGVAAIEARLSPRTRVIVAQNTYGLSAQVDAIARLGQAKSLRTIEDCTHGFGGAFKGRPNGTHCDAAFYSTQWNKPFSTGIGGMALVNDPGLVGPLAVQCGQLCRPTAWDLANLRLLYLVHDWLLTDRTYWFMMHGYRKLSAKNLVLGSSESDEIKDIHMPAGFSKAMAPAQARRGLAALEGFDARQAMRKANARGLSRFLAAHGKNRVREALFADHNFCKYPLLVDHRREFVEAAKACQVRLGDWFSSPLHPVDHDLGRWGFDPAVYPNAVYAADHVVNLPIGTADLDKLLPFLAAHLGQIVDAV